MIFPEIENKTWRAFYLSSVFLNEFKDKKVGWEIYSELVFKRTYARRKPDGTYENWWECCKRVVEGTYNIQKLHAKRHGLRWDDRKSQASAQEMYRRMFCFKFLPPGRGLWTMGTPIVYEKGSACLNNCGFVSTIDIDVEFSSPFTFLMDMSMLGVGVGGDTKGAGKITIVEPDIDPGTIHTIPDSREGWVEAVRVTLEAFAGNGVLPTFNFDEIRPAGMPIRGFGGTSSGPEPLKILINQISKILGDRVGEKITGRDIVDIFNVIGCCVVAGNVRRSAEIMLGEAGDEEFLNLKNYNLNPDRGTFGWASNNSILGTPGMDYSSIVPLIADNGEPGIVFLDNMKKYSRMGDAPDWKDERAAGCNPCSEQTLESFELCCLVETFPANHETYEDYERTLKFAYLYAKTVTLIPTHDSRVNAVMLRNRRIGCSMSGIMQAFDKFGRRNFLDSWCEQGYQYIQKCDKYYSEWLCIPRSIKTTSVKPSGTVSVLAGSLDGIHYAHSPYYIRNVRFKSDHPIVAACRDAGYVVEDELDQKGELKLGSVVVSFPTKEKHIGLKKSEASIWLQVANAVELQEKWADNQVSITVTFKKSEEDQIKHVLEVFGPRLKSISFMPLFEHGYVQAPYIEITEEKYNEMSKNLKPVDMNLIKHDIDDKFCDGAKCEI